MSIKNDKQFLEEKKNAFLNQKSQLDKIGIAMTVLAGFDTIGMMGCFFHRIYFQEQQRTVMVIFILLAIGFVIMLILVIVIHIKTETMRSQYKKEYDTIVVFQTLKSMFDSITYYCDKGFTSRYIVDMDLLGLPVCIKFDDCHGFSSCNYIHASYNGILFKYSDVKIISASRAGYLFYGRILELDYPLPNQEKLKIYSRNFYDIKWELFQSKSGKVCTTNVDRFDNEFQIRCDSEEDFKNIITHNIMEKLELFYNLYPEFAIEFFDNKLYVAVETRRKSFEPDYSKEIDYLKEIKKIKQDTKFITDTIDIFCRDLK